MTYTPKDRVAVDKSPYNGWSEVDNAMRVAIVIGDPPEHIRAAGDAIGEVHRDPIASANLLRLIADEMERRANER